MHLTDFAGSIGAQAPDQKNETIPTHSPKQSRAHC